MESRINWNDYFFKIVDDIALRSTCISRQVGAVLVKDNRILATGYNGAVVGGKHCLSEKCKRKELKVPSGQNAEICKGVHAEQNVIIQCAKYGIKCEGSTLYVSCSPCSICLKMIINCGIKKIKFRESYPDILAQQIAIDAGYIWEKNFIEKVL
jgi:dCMP deaminase